MKVTYARQTHDHPDPLARFAHRRRLARSMDMVLAWLTGRHGNQRLLDYGCGKGRFLNELHLRMTEEKRSNVTLMGYEPFMKSRFPTYEIVSSIGEVPAGSVDIMTCFEVCEHLNGEDTRAFIACAHEKIVKGGLLLVSVPIMAGPALLLKEYARALLFRRMPDTTFPQILRASLLGTLPARTTDLKRSHRGYDWKATRDMLKAEFGNVDVVFSPFRWMGWYGNSQAFMVVRVGA